MKNIKYELTAHIVSAESNYSNLEPQSLFFEALSDYSPEITSRQTLTLPAPNALRQKTGQMMGKKVKITVEFI